MKSLIILIVLLLLDANMLHAECRQTGSSFSRDKDCGQNQSYSQDRYSSYYNDYYNDMRSQYRWERSREELEIRRRAQPHTQYKSKSNNGYTGRSYAPGQTPRAPFWEQ